VLRSWYPSLLAAACVLTLISVPTPLLAADVAEKPVAAAEQTPAEKAGDCPYAAEGECCGGCQQKFYKDRPEAAPAGCPCKQRALEAQRKKQAQP